MRIWCVGIFNLTPDVFLLLFQPLSNKLPDPDGPLSRSVPSSSIRDAYANDAISLVLDIRGA